MMRVGIVGCAGIPANYGGFETLTQNLVKELKNDFKFVVYCSTFSYKTRIKEYHGARLVYIPIKANGRSSILYDVFSTLNSLNKVDIILVLGVGGAFLFPMIRFFTPKKLVVNIDGLEWKRQKWGPFASFYLRLQERIAIKFAHSVIADNEAIQTYITTQYKRQSTYAPYGGNHPQYAKLSKAIQKELGIGASDYFFSVCRIEPENNVHILLEAFKFLPDLKLIIVGNWTASNYGKSLLSAYSHFKNIFMLKPIYELSRLDELRGNCTAYLHGHSAGGTNPSLVEAMNLGLPVICWDVDYNRHTTENKALYFKSSSELRGVVIQGLNNRLLLKKIGDELLTVAKVKYTWELVAKQYFHILNKVADRPQ